MRLSLVFAACMSIATPTLADFTMSFDWGDIPRCTTGYPNVVGNPEFTLSDVPQGTTEIVFKLTDLDVPGYDHGGGKVKVQGDGKVPFGTFEYKSPCPPNGSHTYEWTATAKSGSKVLGQAKAARQYP